MWSQLKNVHLDITVELARKEVTIDDMRSIQVNDVVDFDKLAGEAFDILVNGRPFAEGEIVCVTDLMAIRVTRLIDREVE